MNVTLTTTGIALLDRLRAFPEKLSLAVAKGTSAGVLVALGKTQKERFTGRGPFPVSDNRIGIRTGRLRGSLLLSSMSRDASGVGARVVSTGVKYFAPHEFGFAGTVNVKEHARTISRIGTKVVKSTRKPRKRDKLPITKTSHPVRAHTRKVNIPERRMLRTGLAQHLPAALGEAIERELGRVKTL